MHFWNIQYSIAQHLISLEISVLKYTVHNCCFLPGLREQSSVTASPPSSSKVVQIAFWESTDYNKEEGGQGWREEDMLIAGKRDQSSFMSSPRQTLTQRPRQKRPRTSTPLASTGREPLYLGRDSELFLKLFCNLTEFFN